MKEQSFDDLVEELQVGDFGTALGVDNDFQDGGSDFRGRPKYRRGHQAHDFRRALALNPHA